jgi:EmrB/QacA subfamily drug resistance transporter
MIRPIAIAGSGAFVAALSTSLVAVSTPVIAKDLSVPPADVSWVLSAYLLTISSLLALAGRAADVLGRKRVYLAGLVFVVAGSVMCASAPVLEMLIGARVVQGVGACMTMAVGPAIVTRAVPPEKRARGLGFQLAATYLGLMLGPSIGGALAAKLGWHAVFVVIAAAAALAGAGAFVFLEADADASGGKKRSLDFGGAVLLGAGLAALLIGLRRGPEHGWTSAGVVVIFVFAFATLAIFARHERLHPEPLLSPALFAMPEFSLGIVGAALLYAITFMSSWLLPFQLQREAHLDPATAGAYMTAQPLAMAIVAPISGFIADRWGPRMPTTIGMVAIAAGMTLVAVTATSPDVRLVLALALVGVGAGLYVAPNNASIMGAAPRDRQATAAAVAATARNVGMTIGIAIASSLDHVLGFKTTLFVAAALAIAGAALGGLRPVLASRAP